MMSKKYLMNFMDLSLWKIERGAVLPDLDLGELSRVVASTDEPHQTEAVRAYRKALRSRG